MNSFQSKIMIMCIIIDIVNYDFDKPMIITMHESSCERKFSICSLSLEFLELRTQASQVLLLQKIQKTNLFAKFCGCQKKQCWPLCYRFSQFCRFADRTIGNWSEWSEWSVCSSGSSFRIRNCQTVPESKCKGQRMATRACLTTLAPTVEAVIGSGIRVGRQGVRPTLPR